MIEPESRIDAAIRTVRECEAKVEIHRAMLQELEDEGRDTSDARRDLAIGLLELELARMRLDEIYKQ